jgi:intracellular sulfur oxidation DsrE/DsrF family protein
MNHIREAACLRRILVCVAMALAFARVSAQEAPPVGDKPFAEAAILLQLSDRDSAKQSMVLDVANNLIKHYGDPELVDIEIIAFGPGVELYFAANEPALSERIASLRVSGVRFVVCQNTLDTLARVRGKSPELIEGLYYVQTGVAHIVERSRNGFTLVRP